MLRSQDGVEEVLSPYQNLQEGLITIRPRKDKDVDLVALVELLEKEVGFEPVTQVTLDLRGRFMHREDVLWFEVSDTGQRFTVEKVEAEEGAPPEEQLVTAIAAFVDPHSANAIIVRHWKRPDRDELQP